MSFDDTQIREMNETDVREAIVRPLLVDRLGYTFGGTRARVRTEYPLIYSHYFLGRKKGSDPSIDRRGKCDYFCEVIGRGVFVIEVKRGDADLTIGDAQQAHTYAHHPDLHALYYLVTNGREFRLHNARPDEPVMAWSLSEMDGKWTTIEDILGPDAIERRARSYQVDVGKPLAPKLGLGSTVRIMGGYVTYGTHELIDPAGVQRLAEIIPPQQYRQMMAQLEGQLNELNGKRASVTGAKAWRDPAGIIRAKVQVVGPNETWDVLNKLAGIEDYDFECASEFVSTDRDAPTVLQNVTRAIVPAGTSVPSFPMPTPFAMSITVPTEAIGYFADGKFHGAFSMDYLMQIDPSASGQIAEIMKGYLALFSVRGVGTFEMNIA